ARTNPRPDSSIREREERPGVRAPADTGRLSTFLRRSMKIITRLLSLALVVLCGFGIWSPNASAQGAVQASIAGVVRDTSGAVLPGVTIEASSPVLIEKSRTAVSDDTGRYRVIALNQGTYTVTFTLAGFNTVKREAIELT